jgi:homoaconitase/3-isopropylmalate dehydratase large subunit
VARAGLRLVPRGQRREGAAGAALRARTHLASPAMAAAAALAGRIVDVRSFAPEAA